MVETAICVIDGVLRCYVRKHFIHTWRTARHTTSYLTRKTYQSMQTLHTCLEHHPLSAWTYLIAVA